MLIVLVAVAALGACSGQASTPAPEGALMAVQTRGGMCPEGACETTIYVERDGLIHQAAKLPNQLGLVPATALTELEQQIAATDFDEVRSHPFTGNCPTAFDGQEVVFEFATTQGVERIESCQVAIDYASPLFSAVVNAVGQYVGLQTDLPMPVPDDPDRPAAPSN